MPGGAGPAGQKQKDTPNRSHPAVESARSLMPSAAAVRETIESVVVAFVLAFLFRTFEAEAFVIPTGSMAPTLMGRHKDLCCEKCGYPFQVSASSEVNSETGVFLGNTVREFTCPMCRHTTDLSYVAEAQRKYPSFKGDRILVGKFCYEFGEPQRWDVAVFKYPGGADTNYIKRLVGLPQETIRISRGDLFVRPDGEPDFKIARKPPEKLLAMLQPVFDNDYAPAIIEQGWPARWTASGASGGWKALPDGCSFQTDGSGGDEVWIRYRHRPPSFGQWQQLLNASLSPGLPEPQLIGDFCAYNSSPEGSSSTTMSDHFGTHWVGDLAVSCTLDVQSDAGQAVFELIEGGRRFQCRIDVATGKATLAIDGQTTSGVETQTKVRGRGEHEIVFTNCDDQMRLWVDGDVVATANYDGATLNHRQPTRDDLTPVAIGSQGAAMKVSHLKVLRDIYYIAVDDKQPLFSGFSDFVRAPPREVFANPDPWYFSDENMRTVEFPLAEDQFLALGDNSARSKDSRLWRQDCPEHYVSRELLKGKALYIYWPHSWDKLPGTSIPFPFFPNFVKMGFIR